jgi:hypothetical protein
MSLEEQYAEVLAALRGAKDLAAQGSETAAHEVAWIGPQLRELEERLAAQHRGPAPITPAAGPPDTGRLMVLHAACVALVESDDRDRRRDALRDLLAYVSRGEDLAFLLGYQTGG